MRNSRLNERGSSLLVVVVLLLVLTALGYQVMRSVGTDLEVVGSDMAAHDVLYIAEAGIAFGIDRLRQPPFDFTAEGADFNAALDEGNCPRVMASPQCADQTCPLFGWFQLTDGPQPFAGGTYWVAVNDDVQRADPNDIFDDNNRLLIRSLAVGPRGTRKLIEVVVGAE